MTTKRKPRRTFKDSFKKQMVELHKSGKPRKDILREYELMDPVNGGINLESMAL